MRNLSKDSLETKETFLKLELVRAVHASRNIKHAGNFRKDYLLEAELQEHILRFSKIKYVWRYSEGKQKLLCKYSKLNVAHDHCHLLSFLT